MKPAPRDAALDALRASLERRFRTHDTTHAIGAQEVTLTHPANADDLISEKDYVEDERLPYWADVWPAARILATHLAARQGHGRRLLELGCGAGLVATVATRSGYEVTATDYYEDSLEFTRLNVAANTGIWPETRLVNWRKLPTDLGRFDAVVGSDLLYEKEYGVLVARAIDVTLGAHGEAIIADPGRIAARDFLEEAARRGLRLSSHERLPFVEGEIRQKIDLYRLTRS